MITFLIQQVMAITRGGRTLFFSVLQGNILTLFEKLYNDANFWDLTLTCSVIFSTSEICTTLMLTLVSVLN